MPIRQAYLPHDSGLTEEIPESGYFSRHRFVSNMICFFDMDPIPAYQEWNLARKESREEDNGILTDFVEVRVMARPAFTDGPESSGKILIATW